jgi:hypothetical protein
MGRPKELSEEERQKLRSEGLQPIEVWMPDIWSDEIWDQAYKDCELIRSSEERADVNLWVEEAARETMRLIEEMEENGL